MYPRSKNSLLLQMPESCYYSLDWFYFNPAKAVKAQFANPLCRFTPHIAFYFYENQPGGWESIK
jgi:hypothetical protein